MSKRYLSCNVLEATQERIAWLFDEYEDISVSVSGGKDSTVLYFLMLEEAIKRDRKIEVFFLDQEAEYQATIDTVNVMMRHTNVLPRWYQVQIYMKNATTLLADGLFYAWEEGVEHMRAKSDIAIHAIDADYPQRFYPFLDWYEEEKKKYALVVGIRADESLNRFRAVTKDAGEKGKRWSTRNKYYPLYDWSTGDIWKYLIDNRLPYNDIYNKMWLDGVKPKDMRISNLIHDISYTSLASLQKYEIDTFNHLCRRIPSIHCAGKHALDSRLFRGESLPSSFASWRDYRDYLVSVLPEERQAVIKARHARQAENDTVHRQQVKWLLVNDWRGKNSIKDNHEEKEARVKTLTENLLLGRLQS